MTRKLTGRGENSQPFHLLQYIEEIKYISLKKGTIMTEIKKKVHAANADYVSRKGASLHPHMKFAILTCMDARMDPVQFAGLSDDAYVIRNAGGRATADAIRSLVISAKMLGTREWFVIHHTDCGMTTFTNADMTRLLKESLGPSALTDKGWENTTNEAGTASPVAMDFHPIKDLRQSVIDDVKTIRNHPLVSRKIPIHGYLYDIHTGALTEIPEASEAGKAEE